MPLTFSPGYSFAPGYTFQRGARAVLVHFAAGATDLAAANAAALEDGGVVVDLATDVAATVQLPGPLRDVAQVYVDGRGPFDAGNVPVSSLVDVLIAAGGEPQADAGAAITCAGETGSAVVTLICGGPGHVAQGHVLGILVCS